LPHARSCDFVVQKFPLVKAAIVQHEPAMTVHFALGPFALVREQSVPESAPADTVPEPVDECALQCNQRASCHPVLQGNTCAYPVFRVQ
jgi:hypothetical protein